jgi:hypothetical protein
LKKRFIHILLLCSLFFNIAHATIIALEDDCHHDSVNAYILDSHADNDCDDLCELHHMFHFMAILSNSRLSVESAEPRQVSIFKPSRYTPPFKQTQIKPPIA